MAHKRIYCIPGLGTDRRIFHNLRLPYPLQYLHWLNPLPSESLHAYSRRMSQQIDQDAPIILAVSFGGLIAQEIAQFLPLKALILISSIRHPAELPIKLKIMRNLPLYHLSKGSWRIATLPVWAPSYGVTDKGEQKFLQIIFRSMTDTYRMWGIKELLNWKGVHLNLPILRLHGTEDRLFPFHLIHETSPIEKGTHFMIAQEAQILSNQIIQFIDDQLLQ